MNVIWIVPDCYSFLCDELEILLQKVDSIRVISAKPVSSEITKRLSKVEFIFCRRENSAIAACCRSPLNTIISLSKPWRIIRDRQQILEIASIYNTLDQECRKQQPDVIHSQFAYPSGLGGTRLDNIPQVLTLRGYDILTTGDYGSLWNWFFRKNLISSFSKGVPVSVASRHSMRVARQILGPDANLQLLPGGLSKNTFRAASIHNRRTLGIPEYATVLVGVGNLIPLKNYGMLIGALPNVIAKSTLPIHLLLCGTGPTLPKLKEQVDQLNLHEHVSFLGKLPREELVDVYNISDIFAHPSLSEGFGNVILEAMLHRLVVVASPVGVAPDVVQHGVNGFLPELGDREGLENCIAQAIHALPAFDSALDANREKALTEFTMERRAQGYLRMYKDAVQNHARRRELKSQE